MKKIVVLLTGLPGSGKSTLAKKIVATFSDFRIVSGDDLRTMMYGKYQYIHTEESAVYSCIINHTITLLQAVSVFGVVIDDSCFCNSKKNREALSLALKNANCGEIKKKAFHCFDKDALKRRMNEPRTIPPEQWIAIFQELEDSFEPVGDEWK
jgi:predicted kinase